MSRLRHETLLGLDNVQLDLPVAPYPMRILAGLLDYVLFGLIVTLFMIAGFYAVVKSDSRSPWMVAVFVLGYFVLEYGYFVGLEIWMVGQTPGKMVFGLRVSTREGGRASAGAILVRNAFRSVDMAIGVPFMILSPLSQRIGDRFAGTLVLETAPLASEDIVRRSPPHWGSKDIGLAEEFLRRSRTMERIRADELADRFLEVIARDSPGFLGPDYGRPSVERLRDELCEVRAEQA